MCKELNDPVVFHVRVIKEVVQGIPAFVINCQGIGSKIKSPEEWCGFFGIPMSVLITWETLTPIASSKEDGSPEGISSVEINLRGAVEESTHYFVLCIPERVMNEGLFVVQWGVEVRPSLNEYFHHWCGVPGPLVVQIGKRRAEKCPTSLFFDEVVHLKPFATLVVVRGVGTNACVEQDSECFEALDLNC